MNDQRFLKNVVDNLKQVLPAKQSEVAFFLGVGETYLSDLLNGRKDITDTFVERAKDKAHINPQYLQGLPVEMYLEPLEVLKSKFFKFRDSFYAASISQKGIDEIDYRAKYIALLEKTVARINLDSDVLLTVKDLLQEVFVQLEEHRAATEPLVDKDTSKGASQQDTSGKRKKPGENK